MHPRTTLGAQGYVFRVTAVAANVASEVQPYHIASAATGVELQLTTLVGGNFEENQRVDKSVFGCTYWDQSFLGRRVATS